MERGLGAEHQLSEAARSQPGAGGGEQLCFRVREEGGSSLQGDPSRGMGKFWGGTELGAQGWGRLEALQAAHCHPDMHLGRMGWLRVSAPIWLHEVLSQCELWTGKGSVHPLRGPVLPRAGQAPMQ